MKVRDPLDELKSTELYIHLLSVDKDYADRIVRFVSGIAPLMATIIDYFPFYTRHDAHHGYQVVTRLNQCLLPTCFDLLQPEALNAQEIFLLMAAAYAHDLGMTVFPGEEGELLSKLGVSRDANWKTNNILQIYLRQNHSKRGGEYISRHSESLGVPRNLVTALDLLMKAHNYSIPQLDEELRRPFATGQKESDLIQLALLVCVADAIEFSDTRVVEGVLERLGADESPAAKISFEENMKHVCTGDSLAVTQDGRVIVSGAFTDANVLALAHRTFDQMEEWIQGYSDIDQHCKHRRLKVRGEPFQRDLVLTGKKFHRLGIRLNKKSVINLIASNAVWRNNQGIAMRELVQNSVEACRYRAHHSAPSDKYRPEVRVVFDRKHHLVTVTDNGCGMSERTVLNNFLTVGSSRSREAAYAENDYAPIARFGIGFWSVFTIADAATVSTAAFENYRGKPVHSQNALGFEFKVQLTDLQDFTVFDPTERACGTSIKLELKRDVVIDDVYTSLRAKLLCSMVPLVLVFDEAEEFLDAQIPNVDEEALHGVRRLAAESLGINVFQYRGATPHTSVAFGLAYRYDGERVTFMAEPEVPMLSVMEGFHNQRTSVCGFSVPTQVTPLCIDLLRVGSFHANALTPEGFEFSIDREQLNANAASKRFIDDTRAIIHKGYRAFLDETGSYRPEIIHALHHEAASGGGNVYDTFAGLELISAMAHYPDLICSKLIPVSLSSGFDAAEKNASFLNLSELSKMDGLVFCLQAQRNPTRYRPSVYLPLENKGVLELAYKIAQDYVKRDPKKIPVYLMETDRIFSMLFDNDPDSRVTIVPIQKGIEICMLSVRLSRINYSDAPNNVVPEIRGPWSGAMYWRKFDTPDNKPYLFLGRHRVLINADSLLYIHLKNLVEDKRFASIAKLISLLQEDEAGHKSQILSQFF